jgi:hypothetical protein
MERQSREYLIGQNNKPYPKEMYNKCLSLIINPIKVTKKAISPSLPVARPQLELSGEEVGGKKNLIGELLCNFDQYKCKIKIGVSFFNQSKILKRGFEPLLLRDR